MAQDFRPPKNKAPAPKGPKIDTGEEENADFVVKIVSLTEKNGIESIDEIVSSFMSRELRTDYFEYRSIIKKTYKRPINQKFPDGPKEKITVEERENVNASLKLIRQLDWRATKDIENLLNIQITRTKGESCSSPLIFHKVFLKKRHILVTGATKDIRDQLISKPDLKFLTIPSPIEKNQGLKDELLKRSKRSKGMQSTIRELLEFKGLPKKITEMITALAMGKKVAMTDAEAINLILLSDLATRYHEVFLNFQQEIIERTSSVSTLSNHFLLLAHKIRPAFFVAKTKKLFEDPIRVETNADFFANFYQRIQILELEKKRANDNLDLFKTVFEEIKSLIILARSFQDAEVWKKCMFYLKSTDGSSVEVNNLKTISTIADATTNRFKKQHGKQNQNLQEIYLVYNIHRFFTSNRVWIDGTISKTDAGILESVLFPRLDIEIGKFNVKDESLIQLFSDQQRKNYHLYYPVSLISKAYGYLIYSSLKDKVANFVKGGLRHFTKRFEKHLFDALYERVVMKPGFPIGRNQFAPWLKEQKFLAHPEEYGYIKNKIETNFDQRLTNKILSGSCEPIITDEISPSEFAKEYNNAQKKFFNLIGEIRKKKETSTSSLHPGKIFLKRIGKKKFDFTTADFRDSLRKEILIIKLSEMVKKACSNIKLEIKKAAKYQKVILHLPYKYEPLLQLAHTFEIQFSDEIYTIHLIALPVESSKDLSGISKNFAGNFTLVLKKSGSILSSILETGKMLNQYREVSESYFWFLSMIVIDRFLYQIVTLDNQRANRTAGHIKFFYPDDEKAIIGNIRDRSLQKLLQHDSDPQKKGVDLGVEHFSYGHILQTIMNQKSVDNELESLRDVLKIVLHLLGKFTDQMKQGADWQQYANAAKRFLQLISQPLDALDEKVLLALKGVSRKLKDLVEKSKDEKSMINILHTQFQRKNPSISRKIYYYQLFLDEGDSVGNNLLHRLRNVQELMRMLKIKKCIIFFPERSKESQLKQIGDILDFFASQSFTANMFVETTILDRSHTETLCQYFSPNSFFRLNRLEPVPRPTAIQAK